MLDVLYCQGKEKEILTQRTGTNLATQKNPLQLCFPSQPEERGNDVAKIPRLRDNSISSAWWLNKIVQTWTGGREKACVCAG